MEAKAVIKKRMESRVVKSKKMVEKKDDKECSEAIRKFWTVLVGEVFDGEVKNENLIQTSDHLTTSSLEFNQSKVDLHSSVDQVEQQQDPLQNSDSEKERDDLEDQLPIGTTLLKDKGSSNNKDKEEQDDAVEKKSSSSKKRSDSSVRSNKAIQSHISYEFRYLQRKQKTLKKNSKTKSFHSRVCSTEKEPIKKYRQASNRKLEQQQTVKLTPAKLLKRDQSPRSFCRMREAIEDHCYIKKRSINLEEIKEYLNSDFQKPPSRKVKKFQKDGKTTMKTFKSSRNTVIVPCFPESVVHKYSEEKLSLYLKKTNMDCDNDSKDSDIANGVKQAYGKILDAVYDYKEANKHKNLLKQYAQKTKPPSPTEEIEEIEQKVPEQSKEDNYGVVVGPEKDLVPLDHGWVKIIPKKKAKEETLAEEKPKDKESDKTEEKITEKKASNQVPEDMKFPRTFRKADPQKGLLPSQKTLK